MVSAARVGHEPTAPTGCGGVFELLCFRCGSHVQDGAEKCWNCGTQLATSKPRGASTSELRARQRTGTKVFGVLYKIGDVIANRYRVKDIVGSGGAGVVYRAQDQEIDVDVAIKVINAKLVQTADEQRLFSRQTKIAKKLSHQNVVRLFDEGKDEQRPFFTMQFLEGLSLRKIIDLRKEKKQTFALQEIEPILNQLCQAMEYAHKTTFHGNMKPDNVIVLPDLLKVTDFGLLRGLPRKPFLAIQKSRGNNFRYLAPEVRLEVADLEKSVDIYSLGVVLGEMLTGLVFDDNKPEQLAMGNSGLDPALLAILKRATARAPKDRYASAAELHEDVRKVLAKGNTKAARPLGPTENPSTAAEAPTQRLDISKHGARPVEDQPKRPGVEPAKKPVEVAASLSLGESPREVSGTFDLIDEGMIEAELARKTAEAVAAGAPLPRPLQPPDLVDNPEALPGELDLEEDVTQALMDDQVVQSSQLLAEPLNEISNSSIELISDPRATNVVRVDREAAKNPTVQPAPLPDSALPEPAFAAHIDDSTRHGRLVDPSGPAGGAPEAKPQLGQAKVEPRLPAGSSYGAVTAALEPPPKQDRFIPRAPTLAMESNGTNGATKAKQRPMTRPRMSTFSAAPAPIISTIDNSPGPLPILSNQPMGTFSGMSALPVAPPPQQTSKVVYLTIGLSVFAVIVTLLLVLKVTSDQQAQVLAMQQQILSLNSQAAAARKNVESANVEAQQAGAEAAEAEKAAAAAVLAVEAEKKKREAVEAEAKRQQEEATRLAEEAQKKADEAARKKAEEESRRLSAEADKTRKAAEEAGKRERELQLQADREQKRLEAERRREEEAKRRAEREEANARSAEERARRLEEERIKKAEADAVKQELALKKLEEKRLAQEKADEERAAARALAAEKAAAEKAAAEKAAAEKAAAEKTEDGEGGDGLAASAATLQCRKGMVGIAAGSYMAGTPRNDPERGFQDRNHESVDVPAYCIDYYEYPNGRGRDPTTKVSFKAAEAACKKAKKRLCTEDEWEKACKGLSGARFPYGNQWDAAACNSEDEAGNDRPVSKSGTFRGCRSSFNVFDMSGNVAEWTSTGAGGGYVVKGGASDRPSYDIRCASRRPRKAGESADNLGFRCCADPGT